MEALEVRNQKSATELVITANSMIEFKTNPKTQKLFFACGNITGYVSPKVKENLESVTLEDLNYAEIKKPGLPDINPETGKSNWVPCLMMAGVKAVKSLGANLLR